jgi:hypothetical protein
MMGPIIQAIIQLMSGCSLHGTSIDVLAHADKLTLMSETPIGLQAMLTQPAGLPLGQDLDSIQGNVSCYT